MINITSIEDIDLNIISKKILNVLLDILDNSYKMQEHIIIFALSVLINISSRNIMTVEQINNNNNNSEDNNNKNGEEDKTYESIVDTSTYNNKIKQKDAE